MKTKKSISIKELIYTICKVGNIPQEDELKKLVNEYSDISDKVLELYNKSTGNEYSLEMGRIVSTSRQIESIFKSLLKKQIDNDKCISELMLTLKTSIKLIKGNGKITI